MWTQYENGWEVEKGKRGGKYNVSFFLSETGEEDEFRGETEGPETRNRRILNSVPTDRYIHLKDVTDLRPVRRFIDPELIKESKVLFGRKNIPRTRDWTVERLSNRFGLGPTLCIVKGRRPTV